MSAVAEETSEFKHCKVCGERWADIFTFIVDPHLKVDGYQACFYDPDLGLVLVTHTADECGTTLAIRVGALRALYDGPEQLQRHTGREECHEYCLQHNILEECDVDCELAWARTALQWLRRRELPPHMRV